MPVIVDWISTKERLPKAGQRVLIYHDYDGPVVEQATRSRGPWWNVEDGIIKDGAHSNPNVKWWRPMPKPPKEVL